MDWTNHQGNNGYGGRNLCLEIQKVTQPMSVDLSELDHLAEMLHILHLSDICEGTGMSVCDCLAVKHPIAQSIVPSEVVSTSVESIFLHPVVIDWCFG